MDFTTFFDIYMRPRSHLPLDRDGIEFRYAAASLMIACSKADFDEDPEEHRVIRDILQDAFKLSAKTIDRLLQFADTASERNYLDEITGLIKDQFSGRDKRFLLEKLWVVAYADGRIENQEKAFIERIAGEIGLDGDDVETAHTLAQHKLPKDRH